ncbi:MAG: T9SS type A sorting domain-containing protein, partial [Gemmatimonadetes bacterium]|nr:T9SS type A sorting domain-containing protein [Gemmatimonadota bacterium]
LTIQDNGALESLEGLGGITVASLTVSGNDTLTSLFGLGLSWMGPSLISNNASLETLIGLDSVDTARELTIERNPVLTSLVGLGQLQEVRQNLTIRENEALLNLDSLTSRTEAGGSLLIRDNEALDEVSIEHLLLQIGRATPPTDNDSTDDSDSSATGGDTSTLPTRTQLLPAFPNPSNSSMSVAYDLAEGSEGRLQLYSVSGQLVRNLVSSEQPAGYHVVTWDGRSDDGVPAAAGVYLIRFRAEQTLQTGKLMLLR